MKIITSNLTRVIAMRPVDNGEKVV